MIDYIRLTLGYLLYTSPGHLVTIYFLFFLTWWKSIYGGFCIDDDYGIQQFSDGFRPEMKELPDNKTIAIGSPNYDQIKGNVVPELLVDYYNQEVGKDKDNKPIIKAFNKRSYNPFIGFPGAFMRWHRLQIGKKYQVIGKNKKGHEVYGFVQSPFRHHVWSLIVHSIIIFLCYNFLKFHFGESIAFPATLLFSIHPIISQCVAWISGINYLYCFSFLLANYNILHLNLSYYWTIPLTILFTSLASLSLLVGCFNFAILWVLGYHWEAFSALIVGILIMLKDGREVVTYRRREFKKQNMTESITPNVRKPIVMLKTLWYYICLIIHPKSLGLYHEYGYHYGRQDEEPDIKFWLGLISLCGMLTAFWYGNLIIRFSVVWFLAYFLVFSNFITANQFVVERYVYIPSLSYAVIFSWLLYPYPQLFWLLIGFYAMRSIMHVWTFKDHITFYTSNVMNFPKSEVALGNLGVAYQSKGKPGTAFDIWQEATRVNPHYDVPWFNMHALLKSNGQLEQSREFLQKCMNAKIVHFQDTWQKDMDELNGAILKQQALNMINQEMNNAVSSGQVHLLPELKKKMDILMKPETKVSAGSSPVISKSGPIILPGPVQASS